MSIMQSLLNRHVILYSVKENFCLSDNISSKVILFAFGLAAEIERDLIPIRTKEALAARKERGVVLGHRTGACPKMESLISNKEAIISAYRNGSKICQLSDMNGVSRGTMYKFLKNIRMEHPSGQEPADHED